MIIYNVKPGDNLWSIASKFSVSANSIVDINGMNNPKNLVVGMSLVIPTYGVYHTITPGDTLYYIAARYNSDIHKIMQINDLTPSSILIPGDNIIIPTDSPYYTKTDTETLGYYDPLKQYRDVIDDIGAYLTYLGYFDFPITSDGQVTGDIQQDVLDKCNNKGVALFPVLSNLESGDFSPEVARSAISVPEHRQNLIENTIALLNKYNLKGVIIDFENLYSTDRDIFTSFIKDLHDALSEEGMMLILNVAPKWEDWPDKDWVGFFDFKEIGPYVDRAAIMTYEWGWRTGPPRPTAPIEFVDRALKYAEDNNISNDKLLLGLTLYGYDWKLPYDASRPARTVSLPTVWDIAYDNNAEIVFHKDIKQPSVDYTDSDGVAHRIWFENALSHYYKYDLIKIHNLTGVFYWIINLRFPSTWYMVNELFNIVKII